jgi:hypothetical protein
VGVREGSLGRIQLVSRQTSAGSLERAAHALGVKYEEVARRRRVLIASHAVLGFATGFAWVTRQDFYQLRHVLFLFRDLPTAYALAAALPYLLSAILCYRATSITRLGARIFSAMLLAGTLIAVAAYLSVSRDHLVPSLVVVSVGQGILFVIAAKYVIKA